MIKIQVLPGILWCKKPRKINSGVFTVFNLNGKTCYNQNQVYYDAGQKSRDRIFCGKCC